MDPYVIFDNIDWPVTSSLADLVVVWKQQLLIYLKGIPDKVEASFAVIAYESLARP